MQEIYRASRVQKNPHLLSTFLDLHSSKLHWVLTMFTTTMSRSCKARQTVEQEKTGMNIACRIPGMDHDFA